MKKITLLFMLCFALQYAYGQDSCASPTVITTAGLYVVGSINGAAPTNFCAANGAIPVANVPAGEWYSYTPSQNYTVTISTSISQNNPLIDTRFHVYTGTCAALTCFAGDDDNGTSYSSTATFNVTAGTTYTIAFDNRWSSTGFTFQLSESPIVAPPPGAVTFNSQTISTIAGSTYNICAVDMNGDHLDDVVGVSSTNIKVNYQNTNGTFTMVDIPTTAATYLPGWSMAAGDYNKDGYNDLLYGSGSGLTFMRSNSTGTAYTQDTPGQYIFCQRTNFVDLNSDGHLDAFSCHDIDPNVYYMNNGNATNNWTYYQSGVTPGAYTIGVIPNGGNYSTLFSDFDNDGDTDVFISKCSGPPCELWRNNKKQGFDTYTDISATAQVNITPVQSWSSSIADFDNDGDMDILIGASGGTHKLLRNNLDTTNTTEEPFTNITVGSGMDVGTSTNIEHVAYDFNNDGFVDIMGGGNKIMFNQGNMTFLPTTYTGLSIGAVADFNNDGFLDIQNGTTLKMNSGNSNHWVKFYLQGIQSNSNGIGARVTIYGAWGKQIRDIRSGEGFRYMGSLNAHFGIGQATAITQVVITWPSGIVDTINNPAIDSKILVVEGSTLGIDNFNHSEFTIYPNPAHHVLNIQTNDQVTMKFAQVYDLNGKMIMESNLTTPTVNVESLATGTYILLLRDANGRDYSQKFLKE